ncbi:MAG: response regulator, partial [Actinomycetota bacterium]|nr:response regulator [Actinomycetota bacterium]
MAEDEERRKVLRHELLIVDDNLELRSLLHRVVANLDATVTEAASGADALRVMRSRPVDIALIDLGLPDMSGLQVLGELRRLAPDAHLIVVSADPSEGARLRSFSAGADDFVQKPFSGAELTARVVVGMRRRRDRAEGRLTFDDLHIDLSARTVEVAGTPVHLRRLEFDLLAHLALHPGHTFSREDLLRAVWGSSAEFQGAATVTEHVRRIRNKLAALAQEGGWVDTVQGSGYRFRERLGVPPLVQPLATELLAKHELVQIVINLEDGTVLDLSEGAVKFFGALTSEEIIGRPGIDRVAPVSVDAARLRRERGRRGDCPEPEEIFLQRLDGVRIAAQIVTTLARHGDHDVAKLNISPANSSRSDLLQSVLTGVTSEVADAVVITDAAYRIRSLNPAAELLYGWAESEVIGQPLTDVLAWPP